MKRREAPRLCAKSAPISSLSSLQDIWRDHDLNGNATEHAIGDWARSAFGEEVLPSVAVKAHSQVAQGLEMLAFWIRGGEVRKFVSWITSGLLLRARLEMGGSTCICKWLTPRRKAN
jgi:hypothetical protein